MHRWSSICQDAALNRLASLARPLRLHRRRADQLELEAEDEERDRDGAGAEAGEEDVDGLLRRRRSSRVLCAVREGELLSGRRDRFGTVRVSLAAATWTSSRPEPPTDEALWSELHERLRKFVARRVPDRVAVDDLAQDILLRLYVHIGGLREQERLDAWAYQVARNVIADYWRDRAARRELPLDQQLNKRLASLPELDSDETADQLRSEIAMCLAPMVERLAAPYRDAIRLTDLGDRTQAEAAAMLGLSVPGVKARVQRGRAQLRELLRACCQIELDRRGQITELAPHGSRSCSCQRSSD